MKRCIHLAVLAGVLAGGQLSADEAISITVKPAVATAKGNAQLRVLVARNDMNRVLVWEVDGVNYYRSSAREINGASAPRSYSFLLRELPEGYFEVRATVHRNNNTASTDRSRITVVGGPQ